MINLLMQSPNDADAMSVLEDVKALKEVFDKITIEQGEVTAVEDPETNVTTLRSESSIKITRDVFNELKSKVAEIRSSYIS
jgi:transcription antitermination factor NusG